MNIIQQNEEKINGILETFDRMIVNGYLLNLCNYRQFLYYLIQNNVQLKDFNKFALSQTDSLCSHIEDYVKENNVEIKYLSSGKINNLLPNIEKIFSHSYYWCIDQCEFATDINFKNRSDLSSFYKTLVETTYFAFSSEDIYSFFGRNVSRIHTFKKGEIVSDLRNRYQGYRIKFKINNHQIKMYDKGNNLRIEVTINNPRDFKILKEKEKLINHKDFQTVKEWVPMGKSIANLYRYVEISKSIIKRYIEAMPEINIDKVSLEDVAKISKSKEYNGRHYSAFNVLNPSTLLLFQIISNGDFLINGFTNKNVRQRYFKENSESSKNINRTTRLFSKLKAHGIIKKVARKNKYYLTSDGRKLISNVLIYAKKELLN